MRLIDADALIKSAELFEVKAYARGSGRSIVHFAKAWLSNEIAKAPTIEAEPVRHGRWIEQEDLHMDTYYDCSVCGESFCLIDGTPTDNLFSYCPNCGAKMDGDSHAGDVR